MGMGQEMMDEHHVDQMLEQDAVEAAERDAMFDAIGFQIRHTSTIEGLKDMMLVMLNLIKEQT